MTKTNLTTLRLLPFVALAAIFCFTGCAGTGDSGTTTTTTTKVDRTKSSMYAR